MNTAQRVIAGVGDIDECTGNQHPHGAVTIGNGACDRLRAVILTSATTIGGLTPLLFERSLQAQFLIPMALTLIFGLAVSTVVVLLLVPALCVIQQDISDGIRKVLKPRQPPLSGATQSD